MRLHWRGAREKTANILIRTLYNKRNSTKLYMEVDSREEVCQEKNYLWSYLRENLCFMSHNLRKHSVSNIAPTLSEAMDELKVIRLESEGEGTWGTQRINYNLSQNHQQSSGKSRKSRGRGKDSKSRCGRKGPVLSTDIASIKWYSENWRGNCGEVLRESY